MPPAQSLRRQSLTRWIRVFASGLCMGAADIVPGISGGTVAFILGIYPELLKSLSSFNGTSFKLLIAFRFSEFLKVVEWKFLFVLAFGIAVSFFTLAQFFSVVLAREADRVYLYSAFFGLILASVWFCAKQLKRFSVPLLAFFVSGCLAAYALTNVTLPSKDVALYNVQLNLGSHKQEASNYRDQQLLDVSEATLSAMLAKGVVESDTIVTNVKTGVPKRAGDYGVSHFNVGLDFFVICCGAIAVSAMLLPGISGSYLLSILGMYNVIIIALADFVQGLKAGALEVDAFYILFSMMVGIVIGALLFSRVVGMLLYRFHDGTIATLTGFMVGALGTVWPFWSYRYVLMPLKLEKGAQLQAVEPMLPDFTSPLFYKACVWALVGLSLVFLLEWLAKTPVLNGSSEQKAA